MRKTKILFSFGTRPEVIKMAPLIKLFKENKNFQIKVCNTGQHVDLIDSLMEYFGIFPDYNLKIMKLSKSLNQTLSLIIWKIEEVLIDFSPDYIFVHGDTTSSFAAGLAGFNCKTKVVHIEAGLRSHNYEAPFPEEMNRVLSSKIASLHFSPTKAARENLIKENIDAKKIIVTGNTVVDAVLSTSIDPDIELSKPMQEKIKGKRIILFTGHRRENFGAPFVRIFQALNEITLKFDDVIIVFPVHPNPKIKQAAKNYFKSKDSILLISPLDYPEFVYLMKISHIIISDSGGIQEEAPSLGIPVLVTREVTERMEGILAGTSILVGSDKEKIVSITSKLLSDASFYDSFKSIENPYGDGSSSKNILNYFIKNAKK
jgi:UDP-N-acetylglucosamine 2-epimerase (non-hydrolysing)